MSHKSKKHRASSHAKPQTAPLEVDERDGPTKQFKALHDTISRGHSFGRRVYTRLERLLRVGYIRPEESEAGRRFKRDCEKGEMPHGRSCLDISSGGGGDGHPSMERLDAARRFQEAKLALDDRERPSRSKFMSSSRLMTLFCAHDTAYGMLAAQTGLSEETVKSWIGQNLRVLAEHYAAIDKKAGRSTTSYTVEQALSRFDPKNDD